MASVSAVILVGHSHPNRGGNRPFAAVLLEEGDRPAFSTRHFRGGGTGIDRTRATGRVLVPTLEHTMDDAVLYVAWAVCQWPEVQSLVSSLHKVDAKHAPRRSGRQPTRRIEMYRDFDEEGRQRLYRSLQTDVRLPMLTFCMFEGSLLASTANHIRNYATDFEVCESTMSRLSLAFGSRKTGFSVGKDSLATRK